MEHTFLERHLYNQNLEFSTLLKGRVQIIWSTYKCTMHVGSVQNFSAWKLGGGIRSSSPIPSFNIPKNVSEKGYIAKIKKNPIVP